MLFQVYYNNLLSGIDTHMVNLGAGVVLQHFHHLARFAGGTKGSINKMLNKQYKGLTFKAGSCRLLWLYAINDRWY